MSDYYKTFEIPESPFNDGDRVRVVHTHPDDKQFLQAVGGIDRSEHDPDAGWTHAVRMDDTSLCTSNEKEYGVWFNEHHLEHEDGRPVRPHVYATEDCIYCGDWGPNPKTLECPRDRSNADIIKGLIKGFRDREMRATKATRVLRDIQACLQPYTLQEGFKTNVEATGIANSLRAIGSFLEGSGAGTPIPVNAIHATCPSCGVRMDVTPALGTFIIPALPIDPEAERLIDEFIAQQGRKPSEPIK